MYLVKFKANYADEFDVSGFETLSVFDYEHFISNLDTIIFPFEWYFGTNEFIIFRNKKELNRSFTIETIDTINELEVFYKLFPEQKFGRTPIEAIREYDEGPD